MKFYISLLAIAAMLFQGCDMMEMSHTVSDAPQGVAPIVENVSPAVDAPAPAIQNSFFDPNNYSGSDI